MKITDLDAHNNFTILRLLLAVMVVFGHFHLLAGVTAPPWPYNYAGAAVDCFFVVSGYLVSHSFDRDSNFARFYLRRFFRIYPLYIVIVIAQTLILGALATGGIGANLQSLASYFAVNAAFANFLQYDVGEGVLRDLDNPSLNASLWTLKIEVGFYLLLPFLWLGVQRFGAALLVAVFVGSALYQWALLDQGKDELARQLPGQLQFFVLGIGAYYFRDRLKIGGAAGIALALAAGAFMTYLLPYKTVFLYPIVVATFVIVAALKTPAIAFKNDISYGVYLFHAPLIQLALLFGWYQPTAAGLAVILAATVILAIIAERTIEIPGIALGRHFARQVGRGVPNASRTAG